MGYKRELTIKNWVSMILIIITFISRDIIDGSVNIMKVVALMHIFDGIQVQF